MSETADIVVVGAGHNSLTAAAYLASQGLSVVVLERRPYIGGGVITREVTAPGFKHDIHSTMHQTIQLNPLIDDDELGLQSKFGLKYLSSPITFTSVFPDGTILQTCESLDTTCESIAQFSAHDAVAYRKFVESTSSLLPMFKMGLFNPPMPFGGFMALLDQSPEGRDLIGNMLKSVYDIVSDIFENDKTKIHFMRFAAESMMAPESKGTGCLLYLMCSLLHLRVCGYPEGGSGSLSISLQKCIEHYGGKILTDATVKRLITSGGKATGVELEDGRVFNARKAVVASIHPFFLNDFIGGTLDPKIQDQIKKIHLSDFAAINTHYALHEAPRYKASSKVDNSYAVELQPATLEEFRKSFDDLRYKRIPDHMSVLSICATNTDKTRAPEGKATLYLYTFVPYDPTNVDGKKWDEIKNQVADRMLENLREATTNMGDDNIIARHVDSPVDFVSHSPSFQGGDIMSMGLYLFQFMGRRPTPELANYTVPGLQGFYMCGPFMHPGGGVIGGGRPVAIKVLRDLGMQADKLSVA